MALSQGRAAEILALLAPLLLAAPLAARIGGNEVSNLHAAPPARGVLFASVALLLMAATFAYASVHRHDPCPQGRRGAYGGACGRSHGEVVTRQAGHDGFAFESRNARSESRAAGPR
jgi:hypothetical protein